MRTSVTHRLAQVAILLMLILPNSVFSEIYRNIGPLDTLGDLKTRFPGANFEKLDPAWAQPEDVMYQITGSGMSGTIIVKFLDFRPHYREQLGTATDSAIVGYLTDDEANIVEWVRFIPDYPIPLQRFITKYGQPGKSGFSDEDMEPYKQWIDRGICVYLTDNGKSVTRMDFTFTVKELRAAWKTKHGFIPDFLKPEVKKTGKK